MTQHYIVPQDIAPEASWPVEHRVWASIEQSRPRASIIWDRLVAFLIALAAWPLILWLVAFVAELKGY